MVVLPITPCKAQLFQNSFAFGRSSSTIAAIRDWKEFAMVRLTQDWAEQGGFVSKK
jgi:hypothetical protein